MAVTTIAVSEFDLIPEINQDVILIQDSSADKCGEKVTLFECGCAITEHFSHLDPLPNGIPKHYSGCAHCDGYVAHNPGGGYVDLCQTHANVYEDLD